MFCPFSNRATQLHIPVTEQNITQLSIHPDSSGTTCHIQPLQHCFLLVNPSWKPEVFKCPAFCLHKSRIISKAPEMYYLHLIIHELNRQNSAPRHSPPSLGQCQIFSLWLPSLHCSSQRWFPMTWTRIKTKGQAIKTRCSCTQSCQFDC